jgi:hypothetical protein
MNTSQFTGLIVTAFVARIDHPFLLNQTPMKLKSSSDPIDPSSETRPAAR